MGQTPEEKAIAELLKYSFEQTRREDGTFHLEDLTKKEQGIIGTQEVYDNLLVIAGLIEDV